VDFEHVLVVGAGQMGGGIAQVVAASGRRVSLHDAAPGATERGLVTMRRSLEKLAEKGGADPGEVLGRVEPVDDLVAADLMVEAVVEDFAVKADVFRRADETLPEGAILASNTSSIPITSLAAATSRPDRVIGMHFFNPVPVLKLVEVIRGLETSDETAAAVVALAAGLTALWLFRGAGDYKGTPPPGRIAFLAIVGMTVSALFGALILMSAAGILTFQVCNQV
jgi:3-hydroxybutyryl-CoA dehydrogenase